jgi:hypothetical protein
MAANLHAAVGKTKVQNARAAAPISCAHPHVRVRGHVRSRTRLLARGLLLFQRADRWTILS